MSSTISPIWASRSAATSARASDPLAEPGEGLVLDPRSAGQRRAGQVSAAQARARRSRGTGAQLLTQVRWGGHQDRGQRGAGGLGGLDGVVPVDHQQPQRFSVPIGAHLRWMRGGPAVRGPRGRADGVDRVALAGPALPHVPACCRSRSPARPGRSGTGPGPARSAGFPRSPRSPGCPRRLAAPSPAAVRTRPRWSAPAAASPGPAAGCRRSLRCGCPGGCRRPRPAPASSGLAHVVSSSRCDAGIAAPAWRETPAAIL